MEMVIGYYEEYINSACKAWMSRKHSIYFNYSLQKPKEKELGFPINGSGNI